MSSDASVLLGNGDGTFQAAVNYAVGMNPRSVAVGDFNGDGKPDLVLGNYSGNNVSVLLNQGSVVKATTTTSLNSNPNPSTVGQTVTFVATVIRQSGGTATGTVTFKKGASTVLGSASLVNGSASVCVLNLRCRLAYNNRGVWRGCHLNWEHIRRDYAESSRQNSDSDYRQLIFESFIRGSVSHIYCHGQSVCSDRNGHVQGWANGTRHRKPKFRYGNI